MKKNIGLILGTLVLLILAWFTYNQLTTDDDDTWQGSSDAQFSVEDTAQITKIFLSNKAGLNQTLRRNEEKGYWTLNNEIIIERYFMSEFLRVLQTLRVTKPVSKSARNNIITDLAGNSVKVEVYVNDQITKSFYMGSDTEFGDGNYAILEDSERPFVVNTPSHNGILTPYFYFRPHEVEDRKVVSAKPEDIRMISVKYLSDSLEGWTYKKGEGILELEDHNRRKLETYLLNFEKKFVQEYIGEGAENTRDSLSYVEPDIEFKFKGSRPIYSKDMKVYFYNGSPDYMLSLVGKEERLAKIQNYVWDKVFVDRSFFE